MTPIIKLVQGGNELSLNTAPYALSADFSPPTTNLENSMTGGTIYNQTGGEVIATRDTDRSWSFSVIISGGSEAENAHYAQRLERMLRSGDRYTPLYLYYKQNSLPEPVWGVTGAAYRFKIKALNSLAVWPDWSVTNIRNAKTTVTVMLTIEPYATANEQLFGNAYGGTIWEPGRGTIVPAGVTNLITNPVFGHATYDNDWTAEAALTATKNTEEVFCRYGRTSVRIYSTDDAVNNQFIQSNTLPAVTHVISFHAKLPDWGEVTTAHCNACYAGAAIVSYFIPEGDGWYLVWGKAVGHAHAHTVGVEVNAGYVVFVDGFQIEVGSAAPTPCAYGDLPGCAWSAVAHDSTTVRTVGWLKLEKKVGSNNHLYCMRMVFRAIAPAADISVHENLIQSLYFNSVDKKFTWTGGGGAASAAQTFVAGDTVVVHMSGDNAGAGTIYVNGVASGAPGAGVMPSFDSIYIGSTNVPDQNASHLQILDVAFWQEPLTAAEVAEDYASLPLDGKEISPIPFIHGYLMTSDVRLSNVTDATRSNFALINGVGGTMPATIRLMLDTSLALGIKTWIGTHPVDRLDFARPTDQYYYEIQGAAGGEAANTSSGEYLASNVLDAPDGAVIGWKAQLFPRASTGRVHYFVRARTDATTASIWAAPAYKIDNSTGEVDGAYRTITLTTAWRWYYVGTLDVQFPEFLAVATRRCSLGIKYECHTAGEVTDVIWRDLEMFVPDYCAYVNGAPDATAVMLAYDSNAIVPGAWTDGTYTASYLIPEVIGDRLMVHPGMINYLWASQAADQGAHSDDDYDDIYEATYRPRWGLL